MRFKIVEFTQSTPVYEFVTTWPLQYLGAAYVKDMESGAITRFEGYVDFDSAGDGGSWSPYLHWCRKSNGIMTYRLYKDPRTYTGTEMEVTALETYHQCVSANWWYVFQKPGLLDRGKVSSCLTMFQHFAHDAVGS